MGPSAVGKLYVCTYIFQGSQKPIPNHEYFFLLRLFFFPLPETEVSLQDTRTNVFLFICFEAMKEGCYIPKQVPKILKPHFSFCFAKKPFSLGKVICASQFPCPHPIKGKIAEILKKAPGNIVIPESLGSYKNKQITEPIG